MLDLEDRKEYYANPQRAKPCSIIKTMQLIWKNPNDADYESIKVTIVCDCKSSVDAILTHGLIYIEKYGDNLNNWKTFIKDSLSYADLLNNTRNFYWVFKDRCDDGVLNGILQLCGKWSIKIKGFDWAQNWVE